MNSGKSTGIGNGANSHTTGAFKDRNESNGQGKNKNTVYVDLGRYESLQTKIKNKVILSDLNLVFIHILTIETWAIIKYKHQGECVLSKKRSKALTHGSRSFKT